MPTRLLFVDDDPFLLQAQRRLFRRISDWKCTFCESGQAALEAFAGQGDDAPFDVVVSDMRMPKMNGAELCTEIRSQYPHCVRIMLSGQTESGTLCRIFGPSHQYLQKPCTPDELQRAVQRSLALRERLDRDNTSETIRQLGIRAIDDSRREVVRTCRKPTSTRSGLLEPISQDPGWCAAMESFALRLRPDEAENRNSLEERMQAFELGEVRTLAATACVFAHLCEEFSPYTDVAEETLAGAVTAARKGTEHSATAGWDVAQWAASRTDEERMLADLLHNVSHLLPFKHQSQPQHLSAALLEHLGLPHSVVANVAARKLESVR